MKVVRCLVIIILSLSWFGCANSRVFDRDVVLNKFNEVLNESAPEYGQIVDGGFHSTDEGVPIGYSVYDLSDVSNVGKVLPNDRREGIKFIEGHFYHFSASILSMSYSHIAYLGNKDIMIFKSINCKDKGHLIEEVIDFAESKISKTEKRETILLNLRNYRSFGRYTVEDNYGMKINCNCSPCE